MVAKHSSFSLFQQVVITFVVSLLVFMLGYYGIQIVNPYPVFDTPEQKELLSYNVDPDESKETKEERKKLRKIVDEAKKHYHKKFFYFGAAMGLLFLIIGSAASLAWSSFAGGLGFILGGMAMLIMSHFILMINFDLWPHSNVIFFISLFFAILVLVGLSFILMKKREEDQ